MSEPSSKVNLTELAVSPFDHGIAAQERQLLALGVPVVFLARVLAQHCASIVSLVEPASIRADVMRSLISDFPGMVRKALLASATTAGGIILPHANKDALAEPDPPDLAISALDRLCET